jgi:hypothetical protein
MLGCICEKMATQESTPTGGRFFAFGPTNLCVVGWDCSTVANNGFWDNTRTSDSSNKGERLGEEPSTWCNTQNVRVGAQIVKLVML